MRGLLDMFLALLSVRVGVVARVDPNDTTWLERSDPERLTLETSTGPRAADPRFVAVAGRLVGSR